MKKPFIADQTFKGQDFTKTRLQKGEYENCIFEGCDFSNGYLDNQNFMECEFIDCNLSNANIAHTVFNEVSFSHCKMMGLKFEESNDFLMIFNFTDCVLNFSTFYQLKLKAVRFSECKLIEVDFSESDLTGAILDSCDLSKALFYHSILEKTDFRTAYNFTIDPEYNRLKKAKFSKENIIGLLGKYELDISD